MNLRERHTRVEEKTVLLTVEVSGAGGDVLVRSNAGDAVQPGISVKARANRIEYSCEVNHLGVIIDGNRRYAKGNSMELEKAYTRGAEKVYETIRHIFGDTSIREMSIYAISYENLMRKSDEVDAMLRIEKRAFDDWAGDPFFKERGIRIRFVGERDTLPADFLESCEALERMTSENTERTLNILVAYAGRREISSAVRKILRDAASNGTETESMDVEMLIAENLSVKEPVDLIVRTAGGNRLSGFLPWQSDYAEIIAINKLWPEVEMDDIDQAIIRFCNGKTRHGL